MENQTTLTKPEDITIKITPDGMKGFMTINNHKLEEQPLTLNTIMYKLWDKGVRFGIKGEVIKTMLEKKIYNRSILIAEGTPPQEGKDAIIEYKFKNGGKANLAEDFEGKVDFRELGLIKVVHAGDVLATKTPPTKGIPGKKITGEEIPAKNGQNANIPLGENTRLSSDGLTLLALLDGYIFWEDSRIGVKTTYEVPGDVDMNVGNIYFVGPVKVKGDVKEGFTINAKGDIEIGGGVENATLISEGNIMIAHGIVGRKTRVIAIGDVKCKFIQNANIEAKGNVIVHDAILHSNVEAGKSVFVLGGKKGAIIGGKIIAKNEVNAKNIGNMSETPTQIEVGVEPGVRQEILALEESLTLERKQLHEERLRYKTLMARNETSLAEQSLANQRELQQVIRMMSSSLHQHKKHVVSSNNEGKVSIVDTLWPGVKLTIGNSIFLPKIDYRYVTFVNKIGSIEQQRYENPKIKSDELLLPKVTYWEREIDKVKDGME
ncbi:MAG: FapA family protein [bacterium]